MFLCVPIMMPTMIVLRERAELALILLSKDGRIEAPPPETTGPGAPTLDMSVPPRIVK